MLTTSQKQIIEQIELEFTKLNNSESFDYLSLLDSKLNELYNWKNEMRIQTEQFRSIATDKIESIVLIFETICKKYGFELSSHKDNDVDRWEYIIKMNGYKQKTYNGFDYIDYIPSITFQVQMNFQYLNNVYYLQSSDLSFKTKVNGTDESYNNSDKFIKQIIEYIVHITQYAKKVN